MSDDTVKQSAFPRLSPAPDPWQRSKTQPDKVFVLENAQVNISGCKRCVFNTVIGCNDHPCAKGVWLTEVEAAILRMQS